MSVDRSLDREFGVRVSHLTDILERKHPRTTSPVLRSGEVAVPEPRANRWRRFRDRPAMLERERELVAAVTEVEHEQRRLADRYVELRGELVELHRLLWPPDRDGPYRKNRRPDVPGPSPIPPPAHEAQPLHGRALRRAALASLSDAGRPLTLTEIHRALHLSGYRIV